MKYFFILAACLCIFSFSISAQTSLSAEQYLEYGKQQFEQGEIDEAISVYTKAIELKPNFTQAYLYRGIAYGINRDREKASADYTAAIEIDPRTFQAYFLRADIKLSFKDYDGAIADAAKVVALDPKNQEAYFNRSYFYFIQNKRAEAAADLKKAAAIDANTQIGKYSAQLLQVLKREKNARLPITDHDALLAKYPMLAPEIYFHRADVHFMNGEFDRAIADYAKVIELAPNNALAYANRAAVYLEKQQYALTIEDAGKAISLKSDLGLAYLIRGFGYVALGNETLAQTDFDEALKIEPTYKTDLEKKVKKIRAKKR